MKIGSLCSGYGGLDMAVEAFFGAETIWMADNDKAASKVIAERWGKPNLGDLNQINWLNVEPVDILTAGYPCQPFSNAGLRRGSDDPRHLWPIIKEVVDAQRPRIVILENVRGHLTLGFKEVLYDITEIGYDARWQIVRASDAGAPHRRERLFIIAYSDSTPYFESRRANQPIHGATSEIIDGSNRNEHRSSNQIINNPHPEHLSSERESSRLGWRFETPAELLLRSIPTPLDQSKLNPKFVEYMMGLPEGWVTDLALSRAQQFKLLGNGVVPQQAYLALERLCEPCHS